MEAKIYITRKKYLRDPFTRKTPSYTEYALYVDNFNIFTRRAGNQFKNVNQFKTWCLQTKKVIELGVTEIKIEKPTVYHLGFTAQRM